MFTLGKASATTGPFSTMRTQVGMSHLFELPVVPKVLMLAISLLYACGIVSGQIRFSKPMARPPRVEG